MRFVYTKKTIQSLNSIGADPQHAYLLHGSRGSGKYLASLDLAAKIIGDEKITSIENFAHPNLFVIRPLANKNNITIAQIRELNDNMWRTASGENAYKVIIIVGANKLTTEAANALLKNLEESPKNTVFILITNMLSQVLPTIRSRSQLVFFEPIPLDLATEFLNKQLNINKEDTKSLMKLAHGSLGKAIELIDIEKKEHTLRVHKYAEDFLSGNITKRFLIAKNIYNDDSIKDFLDELIYEIRDKSTILGGVMSLEIIMKTVDQLQSNINNRTVLENLGLQLNVVQE